MYGTFPATWSFAPGSNSSSDRGDGGTTPWYFRLRSHQAALYRSGGISPLNTFHRHWSTRSPNGRNATFSSARARRSPMSCSGGRAVEEPDLNEVLGRDREPDGVPDRLVEPVVRAVPVDEGLVAVRPLVVVVAELVVDRLEVVGGDLDAHLDPKVLLEVEVPRAGVADDLPVPRPGEHRPVPERGGQWVEPEGDEELLSVPYHLLRCRAPVDQDLREVHSGPGRRGGHERVDQLPALGPHVPKEVRGDRSRLR